MKQEMMLIESQIELSPRIFELTLKGELVNQMETSGQFLHIRVPQSDLLLRRPISLAEVNRENGTCKVIYRVDGCGTRAISELTKGEKIDVLGPLGNGFNTDFVQEQDVIFVIGGGIGIPPLYELGKRLKAQKAKLVFLQGFGTKEACFYKQEFSELGMLMIATDDGSYGYKGHTGHLIEKALKVYPNPAGVFACGPTGLLRTVESSFENHPHVYLSMEERMACGVGACYACVCQSKEDPTVNKKVCDEGPVFKSGEVII